jgi:hypothetical protein
MTRKRVDRLVVATLLTAASAWQPLQAAQYAYAALTVAPKAARQGAVRVGSLTWQCSGNRCTISGS